MTEKSILLSVNPPYAGWLVDGIKDIEWRKGALPAGRAYVYETKKRGGSGMVIGEVRFLGYTKLPTNLVPAENLVPADYIQRGRVDKEFLQRYAGSKPIFANFTCTNLRYKEPRPLSSFIARYKFGCVNMGKCAGCVFLDKGIDGIIEDDCLADFDTDCYAPLKRPPQSWCYVEDIK